MPVPPCRWWQARSAAGASAASQYASIEHVSASQLEPGDLIFYSAGGYIYHVVMYIGGGQMVEAPYTGATVWNTGVRTGDGFAGVGRVG